MIKEYRFAIICNLIVIFFLSASLIIQNHGVSESLKIEARARAKQFQLYLWMAENERWHRENWQPNPEDTGIQPLWGTYSHSFVPIDTTKTFRLNPETYVFDSVMGEWHNKHDTLRFFD